MQITKDQVIAALTSEPILKAGDWIHGQMYASYQERFPPGCAVCAVGAVMRHAGLEGRAIGTVARRAVRGQAVAEDDYLGRLESGNYLGALATFFEKSAREGLSPLDSVFSQDHHNHLRSHCIEFVQQYFPEGVIYNDDEDDND